VLWGVEPLQREVRASSLRIVSLHVQLIRACAHVTSAAPTVDSRRAVRVTCSALLCWL
jgi:hypothetical protein